MKKVVVLVTFLLSLSCARYEVAEQHPRNSASHSPASPTPTIAQSPTPAPVHEKIDVGLQSEIAKIAEDAKGTVGVGVVMLEAGDAVWLERNGQFPMQSVYKLPIAMAVLKMVDEGRIRLDQEISITPDDFVRPGFNSPIRDKNPNGTVMRLDEIIRSSISESDGTASDVLLDLAGGPPAIQEYLSGLGIREMIVVNSEKEISRDWETQYRNWASPEASIELLRAIYDRRAGHSEQTTSLLLNIMTEAETGERRLKRFLPEGSSLAHKTGTGGTRDGITGATNDIGIITLPDGRHIAIAVYIKDSKASIAGREKVMADIAKAAVDKWGKTSAQPATNSNVPAAR